MPRRQSPPRLVTRLDRDGVRRLVIRDGSVYKRTGCLVGETESAAEKLAEYIGQKRQKPVAVERGPDHISVAAALDHYVTAKQSRGEDTTAIDGRVAFLTEFWGDKPLSEISGDTCREYAASRKRRAAARRELEDLRAAVNLFSKERRLNFRPHFDLPDKPVARERWLTREEAAELLRGALRLRRARPKTYECLPRFILIGLYTGTRHSAILELNWNRGPSGGWPDLDAGVLYRRGERVRETTKRRPPMRLPRRLMAHLKRWRLKDGGKGTVIHAKGGEPIGLMRKSFEAARIEAGLGDEVTPHILRHTRATWLMQRRVPIWDAAGSLGMTVKQMESTYGHHHPDFQQAAADAY
ncbi:site-specific integrase [Mesorhizobium sp. GbtcB19]|uniref:site-specific integrase n=1 Tax=Mesorhizobium sp. GbtcB19 TaxID=2824764 RepID=UPI001C2F5913|nr:site-specific integrase [Mesorhizobium sp. GbtcB19]